MTFVCRPSSTNMQHMPGVHIPGTDACNTVLPFPRRLQHIAKEPDESFKRGIAATSCCTKLSHTRGAEECVDCPPLFNQSSIVISRGPAERPPTFLHTTKPCSRNLLYASRRLLDSAAPISGTFLSQLLYVVHGRPHLYKKTIREKYEVHLVLV